MAAESEGDGNKELIVDDDLREMGSKAVWSVGSCKPGNGVSFLRDDNLNSYWQSDGPQPHLVNIQFQKKVKLQLVVIYVDFKLDESYTPSKISIRGGDGFHNLKEIKTVELDKPSGWVYLSLSGHDPSLQLSNILLWIGKFLSTLIKFSAIFTCNAGKPLSILLCCKLLCCQTTLMGGILMCAKSKFMGLVRASSSSSEPYSTSAISIYFKGIHYLLYFEIRKCGTLKHEVNHII
ncbi:hypothetical protein Patl1_28949 [Pistacia atlantica]|uniref:Uncharacterized protein n=1 Tax=Pistacia atlantica TaxID=434234 RepID=A0ACC1BEN1_9ROSI|nr:hypothetical protein Patl1_28949 [Pistacia atlantica]